jgi:cobalt/nickel transport system permease protein
MFLAMHIPDGFLSVPVAVVGWLITAVIVGLALRQTREQLGERQIPLMGILAAFIFAAQMINFPVAGGTSGHLIGGTLAAILLGPWAAVLVMTSVVAVQALLFQDGGLLALGFNIFNMGILAPFVGYAAYDAVRKTAGRKTLGSAQYALLVGAAVGAWVSVEAAAIATALQLAISDTSPLDVALPAMAGVHALIGIGEALITVGALAFIRQARPDLLGAPVKAAARGSGWIAAGLVIALAVTFASPLADSDPDGLERVAEDKAFIEEAEDAPYEILPDYTVPGIDNEAVTTILAGIAGVLIVAGIGYGVARASGRAATHKAGDMV